MFFVHLPRNLPGGGEALRDDPKNGCGGDYKEQTVKPNEAYPSRLH